jgi:hypothetical protein
MYAQWRSLDDYETMRREPGHTAYDFAQQRCASECSRKSKVFDQGFRGRLTQF